MKLRTNERSPRGINAMRTVTTESTRTIAIGVADPFASSHLTLPQRAISLGIAHDFDSLEPVRLPLVKAFVGQSYPMTGNYNVDAERRRERTRASERGRKNKEGQ